MNQKDSFSPRPFQIVYVGSAVLFLLVFCLLQPFPGRFILKAIPALSLALAFFLAPGLDGRQRWSLIAGALFCGVGDMILDIDRIRLFVPGLVAFLLGHTGFLVFFLLRREKKSPRRVWLLPFLAVSGSYDRRSCTASGPPFNPRPGLLDYHKPNDRLCHRLGPPHPGSSGSPCLHALGRPAGTCQIRLPRFSRAGVNRPYLLYGIVPSRFRLPENQETTAHTNLKNHARPWCRICQVQIRAFSHTRGDEPCPRHWRLSQGTAVLCMIPMWCACLSIINEKGYQMEG